MNQSNSKLKFKSYYTISGWMLQNLPKYDINSLPEIAVFAIIYAYCTDNKTFTGSLQYLTDNTKGGRATIVKALQKMVDAKILIKEPQKDSQRIFYKINQETLLRLQNENLVLDNTSFNQNQFKMKPVQNETSSETDENQFSNESKLVLKHHETSSQIDPILINNIYIDNNNYINKEKKEYIRKNVIERAMIKSFYRGNWNFIPSDIKEQDYKLGVYDAMTDWIIHNKKEDDFQFLDTLLVIVQDIYTQTNNNPEAISNIKECIASNKPMLIPDSMRSAIKQIQEKNKPLTDINEINKRFEALKDVARGVKVDNE